VDINSIESKREALLQVRGKDKYTISRQWTEDQRIALKFLCDRFPGIKKGEIELVVIGHSNGGEQV
jgi:hypothetical protein